MWAAIACWALYRYVLKPVGAFVSEVIKAGLMPAMNDALGGIRDTPKAIDGLTKSVDGLARDARDVSKGVTELHGKFDDLKETVLDHRASIAVAALNEAAAEARGAEPRRAAARSVR